MTESLDIDGLYRRYSRLVASMLSSHLPPDDVEEAVSETFAIAFAERAQLTGRSEAELATWLSYQVFEQFRRYFNARNLRGDQPMDPTLLQEMRWTEDWHERMDPRNLYDVPIWGLLEDERAPTGSAVIDELLSRDAPGFIEPGLTAPVRPYDVAILNTYLNHAAQAQQLGMTPGQLLSPFSQSTLLGPDGRPLSSTDETELQLSVGAITDEVLSLLASDAKLLYSLTPRRFEEVICELFSRKGFDVTLTAATRDGGADLYVLDKTDMGSFLYLVECKKYRADRPVGVGLVRQLFGVVQSSRATAGILATTSYFTRDAKEYQRELRYQLSLRDFTAIRSWLSGNP